MKRPDITALFPSDQRGLTLLEIIVSLIVAAVMGAMLVQFMGTSMVKSAKPISRLQEGFVLNDAMENMTADYKRLLAADSSPLATLKGYIDSGGTVGSDPYYGSYTPTTGFILFSGGNEVEDTGGTNRLLKVTLTKEGQSITTLFTK